MAIIETIVCEPARHLLWSCTRTFDPRGKPLPEERDRRTTTHSRSYPMKLLPTSAHTPLYLEDTSGEIPVD
ncbi:24318_t:CDS:2 [Dentiscutata erythropus]|uniref:24318_t:CDS:1 n=1 Tax=Dentiscutata erythropus TaxID=1348616 RepID=A0A9N9H3E9_9GLOM|nr:24318_t:CDS:2 [Dentiscutata erythropus]